MTPDFVIENKKLIDNVLEKLLLHNECEYSVVTDAMKYSTMLGGKRIRPCIMLEFYSLFGGNANEIVDFALALELIHNYSLIHDDLPAMDNDEYRRGRKTTHIV